MKAPANRKMKAGNYIQSKSDSQFVERIMSAIHLFLTTAGESASRILRDIVKGVSVM